MEPARLEVGRIGRPHGLHGELTVLFTTNRAERSEPGTVLYAGDRELVVDTARRHHDRWLIRFAGVTGRDAAEALRGAVLAAEPLPSDDGDELWAHELIGAEVRDTDGSALGRVTSVEANPAHDLLVLDDGTLIPVVFVVDQAPGLVVVDLPEGLLEVNRR